ncbi:UBX domain-containing protein 10 [Vermiconidia calcicola]|uniref:UBX domain-containing protein 10 n=1 Tax=Vermiconidia calcicola TaxID=1690605 RepID=A0ACC3MIL7_9PEZI|nr:UBX domain-containing protein 10 [Vermiconidia calcicola]
MADSTVDLTSLTESQQLAVQQFISVTDQDLDTALPLLRKTQYNVQLAVSRFFDGDVDVVDPATEAARAPPPLAVNARRAETLMDGIPNRTQLRGANASNAHDLAPRIVPPSESQISRPLGFPFNILLLPFNLTYVIFQRVLGAVGYLFPVIPRLLSRLWSGRTSQPSRDTGRRPLSPRDTAARFAREFEEEYGVTHGTLPFHEGGYANAFDIAKRDLKYLLIVLLSPEHDDTAPFVRDILLAPDFVQFVKEPSNNIILWAGTVQDAEAYQISSALNVTRFPYACLIVHTPSVSSTAMSKIATSAGPVAAPGDLIAKLEAAMREHGQELDRVRSQRQEQEASRSLRQEQESAYERSLAQDREKARKRKEEAEVQEKIEREERERAERKADEARKLAQWRRWRTQSIPSEPAAEVKDAVRMSIRMPSGERVIRKFRADAELEELYAFVECYDLLNDEQESMSEKETPEPEGYDHEYKFRLVSPMPREVYDSEKRGSIRGRIGRSGNLIVERIVAEDDTDEEEEAEA